MATTEKIEASTVVLGADKSQDLVRFSHLHVFRPRLNKQSKREEYSTQVWIPKSNTVDYDKAVAAVKEQQAAFFTKNGKIVLPPKAHYPIKDGDKDVNQKGEPLNVPGHWVLSAKTYAFNDKNEEMAPPGVVGTERDEAGKLKPITSKDIKSGDFGRISLNFKGYLTGDGGVGVYINNVQKVRDGAALGSRKSASDEFNDFDDDDGVLG